MLKWDKNEAGVFKQEVVSEWAKYVHLSYGILVTEDAVKFIRFYAM